MPWFAWLWCIVMVACLLVIGYCAWDVGRIARRMRRRQP